MTGNWVLVLVPSLLALPPTLAALLAAAVALGVLGWFVYREAGQGAIERRADAHPVAPEDLPELHRRVNRIAAQMDVPAPSVAVSDREAPEAMAVGYRPSTTDLVLSTGTLEALDGEELDAVIAHELAHVANRDAMVMTAVSTPIVVVDGIRARLLGKVSNRGGTFSDMDADELWVENEEWRVTRKGPLERFLTGRNLGILGWLVAAVSTWTALVMTSEDVDFEGSDPDELRSNMIARLAIAGAVVGLLVTWLLSRVFVAVFSRARETVADRTAAEVTGSPGALASALWKLDDQIAAAPTEDLREVSSVSSLSILPLERGVLNDTHDTLADPPAVVQRVRQKLFGTHPPTQRRIRRLQSMASNQERAD